MYDVAKGPCAAATGSEWAFVIHLFGCTASGATVHLAVDPQSYSEHLLFLASPEATKDLADDENELDAVVAGLDQELFHGRADLEASVVQLSPVIGFTNRRKDTLFRLAYRDLRCRSKLVRSLQDKGLRSKDADLGPVTVVHGSEASPAQFLRRSNLRLGSWYSAKQLTRVPGKPRAGVHTFGVVQPSAVALCPEGSHPLVPSLRIAYVTCSAISSTNTGTRRFEPDPNIPGDSVTSICTGLQQLGPGGPEAPTLQQFEPRSAGEAGEVLLLKEWFAWVAAAAPHVLVCCTGASGTNPLEYLYLRARSLCPEGSSLSLIDPLPAPRRGAPGGEPRSTRFKGMLGDFFHQGRVRLDVRFALEKFQVSPPLVAYSLAAALEHPKLIKNRAELSQLPAGQQKDVLTMFALCRDNRFVLNNMALGRVCDLNLTSICERGQQKKVLNYCMRFYAREGLYLNSWLPREKNYVVLRRPRQQSSYPDPPVIPPPSLEELTGTPCSGGGGQKGTAGPPSLGRTVLACLGQKKRPAPGPGEQPQPAPKLPRTAAAPASETKKAYKGGYVLKPVAGLYLDPRLAVATLDFASLYPSIMEGYLICHMRIVYDHSWLDDPDLEYETVPINDSECVVLAKSYRGQPVFSITNVVISDVVQNRQRVKIIMKVTTDPFELESLNAEQLSCKVMQNAVYGVCGSESSPLWCVAIAATVCALGAWMNKMLCFTAASAGCLVVYGDTDSIFIVVPTAKLPASASRSEILAHVFRRATDIAAEATRLYPKPNLVEFESIKAPLNLLSTKKTYSALEYPARMGCWDDPAFSPTVLAKGLSFKKRDRCPWVTELGHALNKLLLHGAPDTDVAAAFSGGLRELAQIVRACRGPPGSTPPAAMKPLEISCRLGESYKSDQSTAVILADIIEQETGSRPSPGERLSYVVADFQDGRKHLQSVVTPQRFAARGMSLDFGYYAETQLLLSVSQLLAHRPGALRACSRATEQAVAVFKRESNGQRTVGATLKGRA